MTELQAEMIDAVTLTLEGGEIVANIVTQEGGDDLQYAFYIFRDGECIHRRMRSQSPVYRFAIEGEPGYYSVSGFVRRGEEQLGVKRSRPLLVSPPTVGVEGLRHSDPMARTLVFKGKHYSYSALHWPGSRDFLFVLMTTPTADLEGVRPPVFNRWNWAQKGEFPGTVLCVSDPRVGRQPGEGGAGRGSTEVYPFDDLVLFIEEFAKLRGIPQDRIVIWGSSGGGLAALYAASRIEGATAVAINAQTDVLGFGVSRVLEAVRQIYFDGLSNEALVERFPLGMDMSKAWAANTRSRAVVVQNRQDTHHFNDHFVRFWESMGGDVQDGWSRSGRHLACVYEDPRGHCPETDEMARDILKRILAPT